MTRVLYWFRNDHRLEDNPALNDAFHCAAEIAFVYVHDPRLWRATASGLPRLGWHRRRFLKDSLDDLRANLQAHGYSLVEVWGQPETVIPEIVSQQNFDVVAFNEVCGPEEKSIASEIVFQSRVLNFRVLTHHAEFLLDVETLPFALSAMPMMFTDFRKKIESSAMDARVPPVVKFSVPQPPPRATEPFKLLGQKMSSSVEACMSSVGTLARDWWSPVPLERDVLAAVEKPGVTGKTHVLVGGASNAMHRLNYYVFESQRVLTYFETRNGLLDNDDSTLLSPWLSAGCISARQIFWSLKEFENTRMANKGTYWVVFELLWREFFKLNLFKMGVRFFDVGKSDGAPSVDLSDVDTLKERLQTALECRTANQFINANMRELIQTGYMSNRGRQNVASYFIHDLKIPWPTGAALFESLLLDYDVACNWGNWSYIAGVQFDPKGGRRFDPVKQQNDYDPQGEYTRTWMK